MAKIVRSKHPSPDYEAYEFQCPGCEFRHVYVVKWGDKLRADYAASGRTYFPEWKFNGSMETPTFEPSLLNTMTFTGDVKPKRICHLYVRKGQIEYLSDCTHKLAGKIVPLPEIDS